MLRLQRDRVQSTLDAQQQQHFLQRHQLVRNHRLAKTLMAAAEGAYVPTADQQVFQESLTDAKATNSRILEVIDALGREHPQYAPQLSVLAQAIQN